MPHGAGRLSKGTAVEILARHLCLANRFLGLAFGQNFSNSALPYYLALSFGECSSLIRDTCLHFATNPKRSSKQIWKCLLSTFKTSHFIPFRVYVSTFPVQINTYSKIFFHTANPLSISRSRRKAQCSHQSRRHLCKTCKRQ